MPLTERVCIELVVHAAGQSNQTKYRLAAREEEVGEWMTAIARCIN
eukprot:SAG31_NODE_22560_length_523_cov_0.603774_2_plen_46_part_01